MTCMCSTIHEHLQYNEILHMTKPVWLIKKHDSTFYVVIHTRKLVLSSMVVTPTLEPCAATLRTMQKFLHHYSSLLCCFYTCFLLFVSGISNAWGILSHTVNEYVIFHMFICHSLFICHSYAITVCHNKEVIHDSQFGHHYSGRSVGGSPCSLCTVTARLCIKHLIASYW